MGKNSMKSHAETAKNDWSNSQNGGNGVVESALEDGTKEAQCASEDDARMESTDKKMKVSIKNRTDGTVFQVEIEANATIGELRSKISSHLGNSCDPRSLKLSLGEQLLDDADSVTLKKAGLVSGDRLFMEIGPCAPKPAKVDAQDVKAGTSNDADDSSTISDDEADASIQFRDGVVRAARDYLENSGFSNSSLKTWSANEHPGAELHFEVRDRKRQLDIFVIILTLSQPNLSAIVNVGRNVDQSHKLLSSFTVQQASIKDNVSNGLAVALSSSGKSSCFYNRSFIQYIAVICKTFPKLHLTEISDESGEPK
ncbi:ubiquitin family protein [Ostertagia ostertagi]